MNDRERKDNELGIDLDMKGLTLDSDEAAGAEPPYES